MKFQIKSFIKKPSEDILSLNGDIKGKFLEVKDFIVSDQQKEGLDLDFLEGYIQIRYHHQEILGVQQWDVIDDLWAYILNLIDIFLDQGYAEMFFPDQPLKLSLLLKGGHVLLTLKEKEWLLPKDIFLKDLLDAAELFFKQLVEIDDSSDYQFELNQINRLRKELLY